MGSMRASQAKLDNENFGFVGSLCAKMDSGSKGVVGTQKILASYDPLIHTNEIRLCWTQGLECSDITNTLVGISGETGSVV